MRKLPAIWLLIEKMTIHLIKGSFSVYSIQGLFMIPNQGKEKQKINKAFPMYSLTAIKLTKRWPIRTNLLEALWHMRTLHLHDKQIQSLSVLANKLINLKGKFFFFFFMFWIFARKSLVSNLEFWEFWKRKAF